MLDKTPLPLFPVFTKLDIKHKDIISDFVSKFPPYSDFNFTSLLCWNTNDDAEISNLNNNLVIKIPGYLNEETVFSLIGISKLKQSIKSLLEITNLLELIPETVARNIASSSFKITEDRDNHDYIYSLFYLANLNGKKLKTKRNFTNNFINCHETRVKVHSVDIGDKEYQSDILKIFTKWKASQRRDKVNTMNEEKAIRRMLEYHGRLNLIAHIVYIDNKPEGFSIHEPLGTEYVICHFQKSNLDFLHLDVFLTSHVAKDLYHLGYKYSNWEQDLGIPGLKKMKSEYRPVFTLKKFRINK